MVAEHLASLGLDAIDPRAEIRDLELPVRQKIEIARAVFRRPRILLLDEPTSTLSGRDIDWLGGLIERVRADGVTVVFISHRMPEVRRFCDRLTVLRNGKDIGTAEVDAIGDDEVIRMIIGRSLAATFPPRPAQRPWQPARRRCWRRADSRPTASSPMPASRCGRARSSASPACRAWGSRSCSSPASA